MKGNAAKEEGDARYALDLLRTAGEIADEEESDKIDNNSVDSTFYGYDTLD